MAEIVPNFSTSVQLKYVKLGYQYLVNHILTFFLIPIMLGLLLELLRLGPEEILLFWNSLYFELVQVLCSSFLVIFIASVYVMSKPRSIYLVDFSCSKAPVSCRAPFSMFMEHSRLIHKGNTKSVDFQMRILERSGLGEETCVPPAMHYIPPTPTTEAARDEAEAMIFSAIDSLMEKTRIRPKDIDILIVNCSLFSPTPSLSAMVVNKYKLRSNIKSFNLSGMGCSAGLISIDLARDLLQVHHNSYALVISAEILTSPNYYKGSERAMLLANCLFRMGGAAILLSNKWQDRARAKYKLVRTNSQKPVKVIAGEPEIQHHIHRPLVLPASEQLLFLFTLIGRKMFKSKWKPYIPDFKQAFEHFCIHAGGRAVIDELQKNLQLSAEHVEASRMTLHRFGTHRHLRSGMKMSYIEAKGEMKKGDRVWQISGVLDSKCQTVRCGSVTGASRRRRRPWQDCIDRYPVHIPEIVKL
ncbi:UNVERIFIED_CONTAM: 3-ketoacyl-CoA synthase 6 [Sesamum angustifolium]|uniref:3-ketoacyl-CoA synthase n=1 Tax=Sesamum angustifolium TaxID=2727405 RepID=A0AAW2NL06_9LAMI